MGKGQLTIKNNDLAAIIGRILKEEPNQPALEGKTMQEQGEDLIGTYALDMIYSGWAVNREPDFTYETLPELPAVVASCYRRNREDQPEPIAVNGTAKALAAYFLALAMNEHGLSWDVRQMPILLNAKKPPKDPLWGVFRIQTGEKKKADFLLPVTAGCRVQEVMGKRLLTFDLAPLIREYKAATGVNLEKHGLRNIAFDL